MKRHKIVKYKKNFNEITSTVTSKHVVITTDRRNYNCKKTVNIIDHTNHRTSISSMSDS